MHLRGRAEPVHVHLLGGKARASDVVATAFGAVAPRRRPTAFVCQWQRVSRVYSSLQLPVVLGRSPQSAFCVDDARVSRQARPPRLACSVFSLADLSYNGTYVRFANEEEVVSLRRGTCTLHGSGGDRPRRLACRPNSARCASEVVHLRHPAARIPRNGDDAALNGLLGACSATSRRCPLPSRYRAEPTIPHAPLPARRVMLVNLGTPDEPTARRCAAPGRVSERPPWWRSRACVVVDLHGIILRVRLSQVGSQVRQHFWPNLDRRWPPDCQAGHCCKGYLGERGHPPPSLRCGTR